LLFSSLLLSLACALTATAADLDEAQQQFDSGNYTGCIETIQKALQDQAGEERHILLSKALLTVGRYPEALQAMTRALDREPDSIRLRWQAREVFQSNGQTDKAHDIVEQIVQSVSSRPWTYRDAPNLVVFAQAVLAKGADPKQVLDKILDTAKKAERKLREVYLASGNLALEKHDFALAAKKFEAGLKELPDDPELHYGLARAYAPSDPTLMIGSIEAALEHNSNHIGCLLLLADHSIDAEDYAEAGELLDRILKVNRWQPEAWAYRAVLAHLQPKPSPLTRLPSDGRGEAEEGARQAGLQFWPTNPRVDYLIGSKLSQNYRFAEGADYQRRALQHDSDYLPAKAQLGQDLLRLGEETEGWKLAQQVQKEDGYDVQAYNLAALHDTMAKFTTLTNRDFLVRMSRHEAAVYGPQVLALLSQARSNLCAKYGLEPRRPVIIEIFPEQKDFAVRTFGMPGNPGYLGVCFGHVVTANSPAVEHGHPVNWQAVLYHEFCHVVTLQITRNKMPRWLSEGISVYEESQANPSWGQRMNPKYREMILEGELTPISKLSAAFLAPRPDLHLQFAYYESSLAVDFIVKRFGIEKLKAILVDLGKGIEINEAIEKRTAVNELNKVNELTKLNVAETNRPLDQLDREFSTFARERAEKLAPGLDWEKPESARSKQAGKQGGKRRYGLPAGGEEQAWEAWAKERPTNFWVMMRKAERLVEEKKWAEAKPLLQKLAELYPGSTGPDSADSMLAAAHRALSETNAERQVLARLAEKDDEAADAYQRLMELGTASEDWPAVAQNARRYLAVNPLLPLPYRFLAEASEKMGEAETELTAWRALLELDPPDPAEAHFRLAQLLHRAGDPQARHHVLAALEEAPRYRAALRLLLEMSEGSKGANVQEHETRRKIF
jgi:predicted Zn-dependent protease